ncbi:MAG: hypothetical protein WDO24_14470 [Pseudomonadota bacterium]
MIRLLFGLLLAFGIAAATSAETYPARPIRLVVPFPAGGPSDFFARGLANTLKKFIDQPVVIDNRSGAPGSPVPTMSPNRRPTAIRWCSAARARW